MRDPQRDADLDAAAVLADPVRRRLYDAVVRTGRETSRDEAAKAVHIDRSLAAVHLDKLVEAGFLEVSFRRLSGRGGPGAGRPSKLYRRSARQLSLTLPARRYETAAGVFATAIERSGSRSVARAVSEAARAFGERLGEEIHALAGTRPDRDRMASATERVLAKNGFEPFTDGDTIRLRNCPFDALASEHRDLVCGMNLALMEGLVEKSGTKGLTACAEPGEGRCCVALRKRRPD